MEAIDYNNNTLFGQKVISTINYNEQELIRDILYLHARNKIIDVDPTYSIGNFYKDRLPKPTYKFDKFPQTEDTIEACSDNLPLNDNSCEVIMFDPPFVIGGELHDGIKEGSSIIAKRFTSFLSFEELKTMYSNSLNELYRILKDGGIVIFKCQDVIVLGKNHFTHCWVMDEAIRIGYYPKDLFILLAKNRLFDGREQQHGRKFHSYFWVFQKSKCRVNYNLCSELSQ